MTVRILLAEDHHLVRQGLRALLEREDNFRVVGEAADGLEVVELAESLDPDVVIMDLMLPGLQGMEAARRTLAERPQTKIMFLSMHADESYVVRALRLGAAAYVLKDASSSDLVHAVHEVIAGRRYLSPPLSDKAIEVYTQLVETGELDPLVTLTGREREVLQLVAEGLTNQEIAERLTISPRTVETHRANLMNKLGLANSTEVLRFALKHGLVDL